MDAYDLTDDLDRPVLVRHFEPWAREVHFRKPNAIDALKIKHEWADGGRDIGEDEMVEFFSEILELCCVLPAATAGQWRKHCQIPTLTALGNLALEALDLLPPIVARAGTDGSTSSPDQLAVEDT